MSRVRTRMISGIRGSRPRLSPLIAYHFEAPVITADHGGRIRGKSCMQQYNPFAEYSTSSSTLLLLYVQLTKLNCARPKFVARDLLFFLRMHWLNCCAVCVVLYVFASLLFCRLMVTLLN